MAISPLDVVKIRLQVQPEPYTMKRLFTMQGKNNIKYSGISQTFKTILAEEGVRVSYSEKAMHLYSVKLIRISHAYCRDYLKAMLQLNIYT